MSLSLSFELEADDSAAAHPPVISSPVQIGAQPVLSESLAGYEPLDDHWKLWRVPAGPYESFRRKPLMTQDQLKKTLRESPHYFSPGVEGLFRVLTQRPLANGSSPSKYGKINLFSAHEAMQKGEVQNLFELFLDRPVKAFFDIDWKDRPDLLASEQAQVQFINSVIGHLSRHCGYSSDIRDWSIQQTLHEDKFSIHLVLNDNTHYANCAQLKAHLLACQVDFAHYGIDTHVYATAQLRALGSGKEWDAADFKPKLLRGINHANITFPEFANGLAQFIPLGSRLLEVEMPQPQGRLRQHGDISLMQEEIEDIVKALSEIYQQELDPYADVSAKSLLENTFLSFDVDCLTSCQCDQGRGAKIIADIRPHRKVLRLQRKVFCCKEATIGYTQRSALYLDMLTQLDFYRIHGLDNLSTSIYDHPNACYRGAGFFETSPQEICSKLGVEMPERWTYFYIPDTGNLVDEQFFKFIRDDRPGLFNPNASDRDANFKDCDLTKKRLNSYMALFACCVQQTNNWYIRSKIGIIQQKKASVQTEMFGVCHYEEMKTKGRGDDKEIIFVEKPYWTFFERSSHYLKAGLTMGAYDPLSKEVISLTPPKQVDVRKAMMSFLSLPEADKACLRALWATYLKMAVLHEVEETRPEMKAYLERWVMTVMFDTFKPALMMVIFMSTGGGQGKSSLGHFLCSFLGYELSMTGATVSAVLKGTTNKGSNGFIFFDEMKDGDAIDELKEAITAPMVRVRYLYENPYMEKSKRILMGCTNHRFIASVNPSGRKDRRFFILYWVDVDQMEIMENGKFFSYVCAHCPVRRSRFGEPLPCSKHGFFDHGSFMDRFHTLITNKPVEEENLYTNGPLFEPFIGMLYAGFLEKKGTWRGTLQSEMPVTKATEECQTKVQTLAGKYIEMCNQRKFHWHPSQSPNEKTIWVIEKTMANLQFEQMRSQKPVWIQFVPKATLYQNFCQWAKASGSHKIAENVFFDQLDEICRSRNGYSIYDEKRLKMVQCENLIYSRDGGEVTPSFKNNNDHSFDACVIDMHTGPWVKAPLRRSESAVLEPSPPQSLSSVEAVAPAPAPTRRLAESSTRGVILSARERAEERARFEEEMELREQNRQRAGLMGLYEEADAQDGFDIGYKRAREGIDEEVDHDLQDRMAMEEDNELEERFVKGSKYLRAEAAESDREDSGEPSHVSDSFGFSL